MEKWRRVRAGAYVNSEWGVYRDPETRDGPWRVWRTSEVMARDVVFATRREAQDYCNAAQPQKAASHG